MKFLNRHFRRPISNGNRFRAMSRTMVSIKCKNYFFFNTSVESISLFYSFETDSKLHLNRNLFFWYWSIYRIIIEKCGICDTCNFNFNDSMFRHRIIMKFIVPSYVRIYSLYIFLYVMLLLTLSVSVAGSCFLQWTQKILTINKKLSRYSLFVFYYFLDNLKKQATVQ